jgi:hypothetical protein
MQRLSSKSVAGLFFGERPNPRLKSLGRNPEPQQTAEPCCDEGTTPPLFFEQTDMVEAIPAFATKIVGDPGICLVGTTGPVVGEVAMTVGHRVTLSPVDFNLISRNKNMLKSRNFKHNVR